MPLLRPVPPLPADVAGVRLLLGAGLLFAGGLVLAIFLGATYVERVNDHRGFHLVPGNDPGPMPPVEPPRHSVIAVMDGLGFQEASGMAVVDRLKEHGRCFRTDTGSPSISRPMYAVLSSGVEQDRTGVRNNASTDPAHVDSIWEAARRRGMTVSALSEIPWWNQLFPRAFNTYRGLPRDRNFFVEADLADLTLIHVLYPDETGHEHGGASQQYAQAVRRSDAEIGTLLDRLDPSRDLAVITADHGHAALGGHGGLDPRIATVLTCVWGRGVVPATAVERIPATSVAPMASVLVGLPFPAHIRAEEVAAQPWWSAVEDRVYPSGYTAARRKALDAMAAEQARVLEDGGGWRGVYFRGWVAQLLRAGLGILIGLGMLWLVVRRLFGAARATPMMLSTLGWTAVLIAVSVGIFVWRRGSFDLSALNGRDEFLRNTSLGCTVVAAGVVAVRWRRRVLTQDALRWLVLVGVAIAGVNLLPPVVYGWTLGFPLPGPVLLFWPYFGAVVMWGHAIVGLVVVLGAGVRLLANPTPSLRPVGSRAPPRENHAERGPADAKAPSTR